MLLDPFPREFSGVKVWCDDEPRPSGVSSLDDDETMLLPNSRELLGFDPKNMAELFTVLRWYRLERARLVSGITAPFGSRKWVVRVEDERGDIHAFEIKVGREVVAHTRELTP